MEFISKDIQEYANLHSQKEPDLLQELNRETWQKVLIPRMLSGAYQGRLLSMLSKLIKPKQILDAQKTINDIYVDEKVEDYVLNLVFATRNPDEYGLSDLSQLIEYGASPRATINLVLASKARAFLEHRGYITPEDVRYIGKDVLRHRVILTYEAEAEEMTSEDVIQRLFDSIEIP